jgi:hypothetical protein
LAERASGQKRRREVGIIIERSGEEEEGREKVGRRGGISGGKSEGE